MKVKYFYGDIKQIERVINDWLSKNEVKILFIKQNKFREASVIISVWYKEKTIK
jgi:hypothetical protein